MKRALFAAVLALSALGGCEPTEGDDCFSPDQNLDRAYDDDAEGCACSPGTASVCASYEDDDGRQHDVALVCTDGAWESVEDGPCAAAPD